MAKKAFTLLELLVVISIIALLLSILMPALGRVKMQAYNVLCLHNLKTLWHGWMMYTDDNEGKLVGGHVGPDQWVDAPTPTGDDAIKQEKEGIQKGLLFPYVLDVDVYHCPADRRAKTRYNGFRSYSIAGGLNGEDGSHCLTWLTEVKPLPNYYVFVEEADPRGYNMGSWLIPLTGESWVDPLAVWHRDRSTLGFADGYVEVHKWLDKSTIEMSTAQVFYYWVAPEDSGEDIRFMQKHYAHKER